MVEKAIQQFKDQAFVFVGPVRLYNRPAHSPEALAAAQRIFEKNTYDNVHAIGPRHFKTLKYYIKKAKFCISFMDMTYHANTVHHHKTLVYLTQGKPVFGPVFSEYVNMGNIMYMDNTHEGMLSILDAFLKNGEEADIEQQRIDYAKKYTFENVLKDASNLVEKHTTHHS